MFHLSSAEHNGQSNFIALAEKFAHVLNLDIEVMQTNFRSNAQLFKLPAFLLLAGFLQLLFAFVTELGEVGELADWRIILCSDLNEV